MKYFVEKSIQFGVNKIDWLRTIYFSLFGSSALTFAMKWKSFELIPLILFFIGVLLFFLGLIVSMRISDSFKAYEIKYTYDKQNHTKIDDYILKKELIGMKSIQHFILYTFFWLAIFIIGYSGYLTETKAKNNSTSQSKIIEQIEKHIDENKANNIYIY